MPKNIKTLRVAVEGYTASDGRTIEASWLSDIAEKYNPETYGARCWIEHLRSTFSDGLFPAVGDVLSVYTKREKVDGEEKLCLYATIKALPALVEINKRGQKIYSSIEVEPNFAKKGKAYLMGLAFTDSPASLGTEALKFNSYASKYPEHIFTSACETELVDSYEMAKNFAEKHPETEPLLNRIAELEAQVDAPSDTTPTPADFSNPPAAPAAPEPATAAPAVDMSAFAALLKPIEQSIASTNEQLAELQAFKSEVENTEVDRVPSHDGGNTNQQLAEF